MNEGGLSLAALIVEIEDGSFHREGIESSPFLWVGDVSSWGLPRSCTVTSEQPGRAEGRIGFRHSKAESLLNARPTTNTSIERASRIKSTSIHVQ